MDSGSKEVAIQSIRPKQPTSRSQVCINITSHLTREACGLGPSLHSNSQGTWRVRELKKREKNSIKLAHTWQVISSAIGFVWNLTLVNLIKAVRYNYAYKQMGEAVAIVTLTTNISITHLFNGTTMGAPFYMKAEKETTEGFRCPKNFTWKRCLTIDKPRESHRD